MSRWKPKGEAARSVLEGLTESVDSAVAYFDREQPGRPDRETANLLVRAIEPRPDDPEPIRRRREIVFSWVWQSTQQSD